MRIIAGMAKGRKLDTPKSGTRPMTGRARESVFSILGIRLADATVLDLFAGSGSLGLESLSRGAESAVFVEKSASACEVIESNIERVGLGGLVVSSSVSAFLTGRVGAFDIVFVDPPYHSSDEDVENELVSIERVLATGGLIVLHRQARSTVKVPTFLRTVDERRYGDAVITMIERKQA